MSQQVFILPTGKAALLAFLDKLPMARKNMAPLEKLGQTAAMPEPAKEDDDAGIQNTTT